MEGRELSVREARQAYFDAWGFGDGGYEATWVALKPTAGVPVGFPNTASRRRAVKLHDIHHVLTGYAADWTGEAEISAWELGAGCRGHLVAWALNAMVLQYGIVIAPRRVLAAFARGRRSVSLYDMPELDERLLEESVDEVRARLRIDGRETSIGVADVVSLAAMLALGSLVWAVPLAAIAMLLGAL